MIASGMIQAQQGATEQLAISHKFWGVSLCMGQLDRPTYTSLMAFSEVSMK
jgi:hypothetical protein